MQHTAYSLEIDPAPRSCAVFSSPHSGADYPDRFVRESCLSPLQLRSSEDAYMNELVGDTLGAPVLCARLPRAYVDLNRAADELDPGVISGARGLQTNPRIAAGLGVIPRVVANGRAIRLGKMPMQAAQARLEHAYHPYHKALKEIIAAQRRRFGVCHLFDLHSMPRSAVPKGFCVRRPDVILGDRFGTACEPQLSDAVARAFREAGFEVAQNTPFAGGYITRHYGAPHNGVHAIQIELDRSLYMNEKTITLRPDFAAFQARFAAVLTALAALSSGAQRIAAE